MDPQQSTPIGHEIPVLPQQGNTLMPSQPREAPLQSQESVPQPIAPAFGIPPAIGAVPPMIAPAPQPPLPQATGAPASAHPSAPAVADDLDLIEKEWVEKAKSIVANTRNDPYAQNQELNKFKADYMRKRYNKDIKIES